MNAPSYFFDTDRVTDAWRGAAACEARSDVDFFPMSDTPAASAEAKAVCAACAVTEDCLRFAFETNQTDGVWGGTSAAERRRLRRRWLESGRRVS